MTGLPSFRGTISHLPRTTDLAQNGVGSGVGEGPGCGPVWRSGGAVSDELRLGGAAGQHQCSADLIGGKFVGNGHLSQIIRRWATQPDLDHRRVAGLERAHTVETRQPAQINTRQPSKQSWTRPDIHQIRQDHLPSVHPITLSRDRSLDADCWYQVLRYSSLHPDCWKQALELARQQVQALRAGTGSRSVSPCQRRAPYPERLRDRAGADHPK
jgi:hypothetical protein